MNRIFKFTLLGVLIFATSFLQGQSKDFKTGKSLEIQFSVLRELSRFYVDSIELDKLVFKGIESMLESLDPYTLLITEDEEADLEMMITGSYGGIGALISKVDSGIEISEVYENSAAHKAGLYAGDILLKVDTAQTKYLTLEQCSARMRGTPGTTVKFLIKRLRGGDVEEVAVVRDRIHVPDVPYWGMVNDTVGYIKITGFTVNGSKDVKKALLDLKKNSNLKRVMLDFRNNGGGSLDEAVSIVSLFVPYGTKVVSALGRDSQRDIIYLTKEEPVDLNIPIVVLVNSGSASSSEIVAGALQDLDRATIVGTKTFGKGLVQAIKSVGYNSNVKLTTAKYYTPSGRCVQAIDYSNRNEDGSVGFVPDSLKRAFKTKLGRTVYDGGGITPDVVIETQIYSRTTISLVYANIFRDYSILFFKENLTINRPSQFHLSDEEYIKFVNYAVARDFDHRTASEVEYDRLVDIARREGLIENFEIQLKELESRVKLSKRDALIKNMDEIKPILEEEICSRYYFQSGRIEKILTTDEQLIEALSVTLIKTGERTD